MFHRIPPPAGGGIKCNIATRRNSLLPGCTSQPASVRAQRVRAVGCISSVERASLFQLTRQPHLTEGRRAISLSGVQDIQVSRPSQSRLRSTTERWSQLP